MYLEENKIYTNAELAEWFKIKPETFKRAKRKKLEILKDFADYEEIKGKVRITKVREPLYIKNHKKQKNNKNYQKMCIVVTQKGRLQTYVSVTTDIWLTRQEELMAMGHKSFYTSYDYVRNNMKILFMEHDGEQPLYGKCLGDRWCKRFEDDEGFIYYIEMTDEEKDFWFTLRESFYRTYKKCDWETQRMLSEGETTLEEIKEQQGELYVDNLLRDWDIFEAKYGGRPASAKLYLLPGDEGFEDVELITA